MVSESRLSALRSLDGMEWDLGWVWRSVGWVVACFFSLRSQEKINLPPLFPKNFLQLSALSKHVLAAFLANITLGSYVDASSVSVHPIPKSPWVYQYIRCRSWQGSFTNEAEAVQRGIEAIYGACATVRSQGPWGTLENPQRGPCGSTKLHPRQPWDYSSNVEVYNNRHITAYTNCSQTSHDGIALRRQRVAGCPQGYEFVSSERCDLTGINPLKNAGQRCPVTGNPVNPATGGKIQYETDTTGTGVEFTRYYNSNAGFPGVSISLQLGENWTSTYSRYVHVSVNYGATVATVLRQDGRAFFFRKNGTTNDYIADSDIHAALDALTDIYGTVIGWRYTNSDNSIELYDENGNLLSIIDRQGKTIELSYDDFGYLTQVRSDTGGLLNFGYDDYNRLSTINDGLNGIIKYHYDANNNLEYVDNPAGTIKQYHYEDPLFPHALTGITDERGIRYATYEYYPDGRAKASYHAGNAQRVDIAYNDTDGTRTVTNSKGVASTYNTQVQLGIALVTAIDGPGCATCGSGDTSYEYDPANNNLLVKVEQGTRTEYGDYDAKGQYGYKIEAVGTPVERRTDYTYDPRFYNKITSITEPSVHSGSNKVTSYSYDDWGNRLTTTISGFAPDGTPVSRATTYVYEGPLHQLSFIDGPRTEVNDITYYRYYPNDASVPVGSRARLREIKNANGIRTRANIEYTPTGKVLAEDRPNGLRLSYRYYPGNDRLETLTESAGTTSRTTRWTYLATGEVETITQAWGTVDATTLTFGYDDARRLTRITDGLGNYIEYTLDTEGNREAEKTYDSGGTLRKQLTQTFDLYNRLDTTAQANETTDPSFAPDGTLDLATDGNGAITDYRYDDLKRLIQMVQDQNGSDPASANATTDYAYDRADRLTLVTASNNATTTYAYDDLGNLLTQTSPDTGTTDFSYDAAGNLKTRTEALGTPQAQTTTYAYDALNRLTGIDALFTESDAGYQYDTCPGGQGRLCRVSTASGAVQYAYDGFGQLIRHQAVRYGYDAAGRLQSLIYPSGAQLTYAYDAAGQLSRVEFSHDGFNRTLATNAGYYPFGPLASLTLGNGLQLTQTLDDAYRLREQRIPGIWERTYHNAADPDGYDANGNLRVRIQDAAMETFGYDALNRLDIAAGPFGNRDYDYDANGNRIGLTADAQLADYAYTPSTNRLSSLAGTPVTLDAFGNTRSQSGWSYDYTPAHRLAAATQGAQLKASFAYNGLGQRTRKTDEPSGESHVFLYDSGGRLLAEADGEGNLLVEYFYANGQLLALYRPDDNRDGIPNAEVPYAQRPLAEDKDGDGLRDVDEWLVHGTDARTSDTDGDGVHDGQEILQGTDPLLTSSHPGSGDLNGNGQLDVGDLLLVTQIALGTRTAANDPDYARKATLADINQDSEVNVADALLLQQRILAGDTFPPQAALEPVAPEAADGADKSTSLATFLDYLIHPAQAAPGDPGQLLYVHVDHLGTPMAMTDEAGTKVWNAVYDPFGKATATEDPDGDGQTVTLNVRFAGQYFDQETGLHYNYFRYYDPGTGRYTTSDPIGLNGGLNTYAYVGGNPLRFSDIFGLEVTCEWIATRYYDKVIPKLLQPELGYWREVCFPVPVPTVGIPDPVPNRRPGFPSPLDITFQKKCVREWIVTQEEKYGQDVEKWMSSYMKCTDSCTGEVKNYWGADRPVNNPPQVN